jgi:Protein of unknown function (DUF3099)
VPAKPAEVHRISGARTSHSEDLDRRVKRYLISMAIRTACVVLAVVVSGPFRWIFIVGAVILPYIAVVMANAVGTRRGDPIATVAPPLEAVPLAVSPSADAARVYIPEPDPDVTSTERVIRGSNESTA